MNGKHRRDLMDALCSNIAGLENVDVVKGRKHTKIVLSGSGRSAFIFTSATPSDHRVLKNVLRDARKAFSEASQTTTGSNEAA